MSEKVKQAIHVGRHVTDLMRLPITYQVEAWRPMADIINEYINHGVITTEPDPKADIKAKRIEDCNLEYRTAKIYGKQIFEHDKL